MEKPVEISAGRARPGDRVLLSGYVGDHGMAILSKRENLEFEGAIESDTAPLHGLVAAMLEASYDIHCLRDPTRGGLATTLTEFAAASGVGIELIESQIPVREAVRGACEILGLDPLYVANEGKLVAVVAPQAAQAVLDAMRTHPLGRDACLIGEVVAEHPHMVIMKTGIGGSRIVDTLFGEQLPRIC
jgi:hydrogenase expression/formation protein HypE